MSVTIILTCIYGITPAYPGSERKTSIRISSRQYTVIRDEEGNQNKLELCFKTWGEQAELAWYELSPP